MTALPEFRLETFFSRWEFAARHHLTASDAQSMTMAELLELADDEDRLAWQTLSLGYTRTFGDPALRRVIAETYEHADADDVICFAGAEEALYLSMQVLLGPGDHAVVVTPNYQARNRAIIAANLPAFDAFFAEFAELFSWRAPAGGCVAYPRYLGADGVERFCEVLLEEAGVLLLPASVYRSELTPTPADRFRIGVGRHAPEPALEAFASWLRARG